MNLKECLGRVILRPSQSMIIRRFFLLISLYISVSLQLTTPLLRSNRFGPVKPLFPTPGKMCLYSTTADEAEEVDVVIIGAGLSGLCAGSMLAQTSRKVSEFLVINSFSIFHRVGATTFPPLTFPSHSALPTSPSHIPLTLPSQVLVLESHDTPGGCCHTWTRRTPVGTFHFESGPSLYSGLSSPTSFNPLSNVFDIIGERPEVKTYDRWGTVFPDGR